MESNDKVILVPGEYGLDPSHTTVGFVAKHLVVTKVKGNFENVEARITVRNPLENSELEVTIQTASLNSRDEKRDTHLKSADFFDIEKYPTIMFNSKKILDRGNNRYDIEGDLTIKRETHPVTLDTEFSGVAKTPWGTEAAGFSASTEIDREVWGLTWNVALESGGLLVSKKILLEIEAEIIPKPTS